MTTPKNRLSYGDNLDALRRRIASGGVDLVVVVVLALHCVCFGTASAGAVSPEPQAREDFKLTEVEPYYTRYKAVISCIRTMSANSTGGPEERFKIVTTFCQENMNDLRALLGSKIGIARATKAMDVFGSDLMAEMKLQSNSTQTGMTVDERLVKESVWSSDAWHVLKVQGQCVALHRYQGSTTFGGLSFAGGTIQDILIGDNPGGTRVLLYMPAAGHAHDLAFYEGRSIKLTFAAQPINGGQRQLVSDDVKVDKLGETYNIDLDSLDETERVLTRYKVITIEAVDGNRSNPLYGYSYDLRGLSEAIMAYRRCKG